MTRPGPLLACLLIAAAAAVTGARQPEAATRAEVRRIVVEESLRVGFPPSLAMAVAEAESGFRDHALGPAGARGVMQITPKTARDLYGAGPDALWDARENARMGIGYLERLIRRYQGRWDLALSHYNGGPGPEGAAQVRVKRATRAYVDRATRAHVDKVLRLQKYYRREAKVWAAELKGAATDWPALHPNYGRVLRLAALARDAERGDRAVPRAGSRSDLDDFEKAIEVRRRMARPYLDDFAAVVRRRGG